MSAAASVAAAVSSKARSPYTLPAYPMARITSRSSRGALGLHRRSPATRIGGHSFFPMTPLKGTRPVLIDVASAKLLDVYHMLVSVVTPRPIAWVTTIDVEGRVNLAPFSFFNAFGANPPVVVFSPLLRRDGSRKDSLRNLEAVPEFELNAAVEDLAVSMNLTAKEIPRGESEVELAGLQTVPS